MLTKLLLISLLIAFQSLLFSQENSKDSLKIGPVTDTIDVNSNLFKRNSSVNTGYTNVVFEEIHKTPGALEDVIKYFVSSIGVSVGNDLNNLLLVRGGSPIENLTVIDGIEVQNPNHFGAPGSTGGVLSYINLKMVKDVDFFAGGFPVKFGDRISSVMDIKFKDSSSSKHIRDINLSATGFGGFFEGPINSKSSYMFSIRRSYLELVKDQLNTDLLPQTWDFNLKLNYNISKKSKISLLAIFATDYAFPYKDNDFKYDTARVKILSSGVTYKNTGKDYELKFSMGYNWNFYKVDYRFFRLDINDNEAFYRQEFNFKAGRKTNITIFTGMKYLFSKYKVNFSAGFNTSNYYTPPQSVDSKFKTYKLSGGISISSYLLNSRVLINMGLRFDNFPYIADNLAVSPRAGITYMLDDKTFLNASAGIYLQSPELLWILTDNRNRNLKYIKANEYILGAEHNLGGSVKITAEAYLKQYSNYPVSVYNPYYIFINSGVNILEPNFLDAAVSNGNGYYTGIDVSIQKKNSGYGFYGTAAYSFSRSGFAAMRGGVQPAEFDFNNQCVLIAGLKIHGDWSFSSRFKYAGGRPYTPFNIPVSTQLGTGIYNIAEYNKSRLPEYIRMDARVDKNFSGKGWNLDIYLEVENIFNRENIYDYYWSWITNSPKPDLQLFILPILGLSCQF